MGQEIWGDDGKSISLGFWDVACLLGGRRGDNALGRPYQSTYQRATETLDIPSQEIGFLGSLQGVWALGHASQKANESPDGNRETSDISSQEIGFLGSLQGVWALGHASQKANESPDGNRETSDISSQKIDFLDSPQGVYGDHAFQKANESPDGNREALNTSSQGIDFLESVPDDSDDLREYGSEIYNLGDVLNPYEENT
jgi:hypothetical protein